MDAQAVILPAPRCEFDVVPKRGSLPGAAGYAAFGQAVRERGSLAEVDGAHAQAEAWMFSSLVSEHRVAGDSVRGRAGDPTAPDAGPARAS